MWGREMTGSSSPFSLFEAPFKVIEERVPLGRFLVTTVSLLMAAVITVFCAQYLFVALDVAATWITRSIKIGELAPFPWSSYGGPLIQWILIFGLSVLLALTVYVRRQERKLADQLIHYVKQEVLPATEKFAQAAVQGQRETVSHRYN
jgi:hypothetical protein